MNNSLGRNIATQWLLDIISVAFGLLFIVALAASLPLAVVLMFLADL